MPKSSSADGLIKPISSWLSLLKSPTIGDDGYIEPGGNIDIGSKVNEQYDTIIKKNNELTSKFQKNTTIHLMKVLNGYMFFEQYKLKIE